MALKKYNVKNEDSLKTLYRELVVLSQLKHPNIIPVNLFIEDKGAVYVEFPLYSSDMEEWLKTSPSCVPWSTCTEREWCTATYGQRTS